MDSTSSFIDFLRHGKQDIVLQINVLEQIRFQLKL
jgi:hypothetical protein